MNSHSAQMSLLDLEIEEQAERSLHPGQWRLARLEIVNWGTFEGHVALPVDRRGLLITGPSGSGKSTLLDAITTVLTPPRSRHLNAAARSGNSKGEDRTIGSYIRGAWRHETNESGEIAHSYLRPNRALWSGIMLRYECGLSDASISSEWATTLSKPINLVVLYNLKAGSIGRDGLSELFAVVRGDHSLLEFEPYAVNGIDIGAFKRAYKEQATAYRDHSPFAQDFCRAMGIASTKTLDLLHKTQAAKNFGSLDELFRKFMLDEPQTFNQADQAAEQFSALSKAYDGVVDQRKQMQELEPLIGLHENYQKAESERETYLGLIESLDGFTEHLVVDILLEQEEQLRRQTACLEESLKAVENERRQAEQALQQAQSVYDDAGGAILSAAELDKCRCQTQLENVARNRTKLLADMASADISTIPTSYAEWENFVRQIDAQAQQANNNHGADKERLSASYAAVDKLKTALSGANTELIHLRSRATNMPAKLHQVRADIAKHLGVPAEELPFMGELVSVKAEHRQWQGAIERLLGQQARTLLVAAKYTVAVSRYLESTHLGLRLEFESVSLEVEVPTRSLKDSSAVRKVSVIQHKSHPEYVNWVNRMLRERFDYICVDSPAQLSAHTHALTIGGQIKRQNRYIKDDRFTIDDRSRWLLGDNNDLKIEQLEQKASELQVSLQEAERQTDLAMMQVNKARDLMRTSELLKDAQWESYDEETARKDRDAAERLSAQLRLGSEDVVKAEKLCREAKQKKQAADEAFQEAKVSHLNAEKKLQTVLEKIAGFKSQADKAKQPTKEDCQVLTDLFAKEEPKYRADDSTIYRISNRVQTILHAKAEKALQSRQLAQAGVERVLHDFKQHWPIVSANLSEDFADRDGYLAVYQSIKTNGLPDYEQKFMQVLQDFSQDQITVIASTIRGAYREIREKLVPVNQSLRMSEYSKGIHLQIEVRDTKSRMVVDFLAELQAITQGTWNDQDLESAESRYLRTAAIIRRFKSDETADRNWKRSCLDTREHVNFIAREIDCDGGVQGVYGSDAGLSGGQKQKLVIFCLAAALRYQLADEQRAVPSYGTVVLDEAFDKADRSFAATAMDIFEVFGFHMILATPLKLIQLLEKHVGAIASIHCQESQHSSFQLVAIEEQNDAAETR